jgi:exopolyphosphatase/pppGpp-phosphohydrolase
MIYSLVDLGSNTVRLSFINATAKALKFYLAAK